MNTELDKVLASQPPIISKALPSDKKKRVRKPAVKAAAKRAPAKKIAAKKVASKKTVPAKKAAPKVDGGKTKAQIARELYAKMKNKPRADILAAFIDKAGLTKAGANTYLANCRKADQ